MKGGLCAFVGKSCIKPWACSYTQKLIVTPAGALPVGGWAIPYQGRRQVLPLMLIVKQKSALCDTI